MLHSPLLRIESCTGPSAIQWLSIYVRHHTIRPTPPGTETIEQRKTNSSPIFPCWDKDRHQKLTRTIGSDNRCLISTTDTALLTEALECSSARTDPLPIWRETALKKIISTN